MEEIEAESEAGSTPALTYFPDEVDSVIRRCERFCVVVAMITVLIGLVAQSLDLYLRTTSTSTGTVVAASTGLGVAIDCAMIAADLWVLFAAAAFRRSVNYESVFIASLSVRFTVQLVAVCLAINEYRKYLGNWTSAFGSARAHVMFVFVSIQYAAHLVLTGSLIAAVYFLGTLRAARDWVEKNKMD
jgi:hypothetical protein